MTLISEREQDVAQAWGLQGGHTLQAARPAGTPLSLPFCHPVSEVRILLCRAQG